jgi:hypothetical protein
MKRLSLILMLPVSMFLMGSAEASYVPQDIVKAARAQVAAPLEWDGEWTTVDTVYTCQGAFQSTSPGGNTICGGTDYTPAGPVPLTCTGTADATTIDLTCTGSGLFFPDCDANYTVVTHGTLTADTYFMVSTVNIAYTGIGCSGLPPTCVQVNSHGTRTGPSCVTPTRRSTWGELKIRYR